MEETSNILIDNYRYQRSSFLTVWNKILIIALIFSTILFSFVEGYTSIIKYIGLTSGLFFVLYWLKTGIDIRNEVLLYGLWGIWSLTGVFVAIDLQRLFINFYTVLQTFVLMMIVSNSSKLFKKQDALIYIYLIGTIILVTVGVVKGDLYEIIILENMSSRYAGYYNANPNSFSGIIIFGLMAAFYYFVTKKELYHRITATSIIILFILMLILSGSRTTFVIIPVMLITYNLLRVGKFNVDSFFAIITIGLVILSFILLVKQLEIIDSYVLRRVVSVVALDERTTEDIRVLLILEAIGIFLENPILGIGLKQNRLISEYDLFSHTEYMEILNATGIIGAIIYFAMYFILAKKLIYLYRYNRKQDETVVILLSFLITFSIMYITFVMYYHYERMIFIALMIGIVNDKYRKYKQSLL